MRSAGLMQICANPGKTASLHWRGCAVFGIVEKGYSYRARLQLKLLP